MSTNRKKNIHINVATKLQEDKKEENQQKIQMQEKINKNKPCPCKEKNKIFQETILILQAACQDRGMLLKENDLNGNGQIKIHFSNVRMEMSMSVEALFTGSDIHIQETIKSNMTIGDNNIIIPSNLISIVHEEAIKAYQKHYDPTMSETSLWKKLSHCPVMKSIIPLKAAQSNKPWTAEKFIETYNSKYPAAQNRGFFGEIKKDSMEYKIRNNQSVTKEYILKHADAKWFTRTKKILKELGVVDIKATLK